MRNKTVSRQEEKSSRLHLKAQEFSIINILANLRHSNQRSPLTHFGENDAVLSATLWTVNRATTVSFLFLVQPALQTRLVDPFGAAFTPAGAHPFCAAVVPLGGKAHPAVSANTNTHT